MAEDVVLYRHVRLKDVFLSGVQAARQVATLEIQFHHHLPLTRSLLNIPLHHYISFEYRQICLHFYPQCDALVVDQQILQAWMGGKGTIHRLFGASNTIRACSH